jgi:monooxygenase
LWAVSFQRIIAAALNTIEHFDVIIVGAGLSGIGAGYRLQTHCRGKSYAILEARPEIGGTWDLFRYPGVRSDSDMFTLGYPFRPWKDARAIADGPSILKYVRDTAREFGIDRHIRFGKQVKSASWSSEKTHWLLEVEDAASGKPEQYSCSFLYGCTGYYRYDSGYVPDFPGVEQFGGQFIHPQHWPENLDYAGKKIVVIGSGATAVTLVPAIAETAAHVTMLQRSPTYILSVPAKDPIERLLHKFLPERAKHRLIRWKNILVSVGIFQLSRRAPEFTRKLFRKGAAKDLPQGYEVERHFQPRYQPWDQRLCLVPDSDLFKSISAGKASIVTDQIESFTEHGIRLQSGEHLNADIVVSATGLQLLAFGAVSITVDGVPFAPSRAFVYKGCLLSNLPNFAFCVGYTNASWTLRSDLISIFVCRLLNRMDRKGYRVCKPVCDTASLEERPLLGLNSGYVLRATPSLPKQSTKRPWLVRQNYFFDLFTMRLSKLEDGILQFEKLCPAPGVDAQAGIRTAAPSASD